MKTKTVKEFNKKVQTQKAPKLYKTNSTLVSSVYTFSLAGNIIVYTPNQGTNREKYFIQIIYKRKDAKCGGK